MNPFVIGMVGALGCVIGDYLIFRFVKNNLVEELKMILDDIGNSGFHNSIFYKIFPFSNLLLSRNFRITMFKISKSKFWRRLMAFVSSLIIISPFLDEIGISMLGMIKFDTKYFIIYSYLFNFIGIFLISSLGGIL